MRLNKSFIRPLCLFCVVLLTLTSCIRHKKWNYIPSRAISRPPLLDKSIVVYPFSDNRNNEDTEHLWCLLPFVISCNLQNPRPENISRHLFSKAWTFNPTEDIAKGFSSELKGHHLFKNVVYSTTKIPADLELHGTLHSTVYEQDLMVYGLSFLGFFVWAAGAPWVIVGNHLAFEVALHDQTSGAVIWENVYEGEFENYFSHYYRWRPLDFAYDKLLSKMMPAILADLEYAISVTAF